MQKRRSYAAWMILLATMALVPAADTWAQVAGPGEDPAQQDPPSNEQDPPSNEDPDAQDPDDPDKGDQDDQSGGDNNGGIGGGIFGTSWMLLLMLGGFMVLWIFMGRSRRKQQQKRKEMLSQLKKGDKVITIGGILGTVMEVRANEISVKVDETNNTRMHFARWAIQSVGEEATDESPHQQ
jgi:preprotein translocase subunit YajC